MSTTWHPSASISLLVALARGAGGLWRAYQTYIYRRSVVRTLQSLDDRTLKDIGISRGEIEAAVAELAAETVETAPAISRKSPSLLHVALKQPRAASAISPVQGECCRP